MTSDTLFLECIEFDPYEFLNLIERKNTNVLMRIQIYYINSNYTNWFRTNSSSLNFVLLPYLSPKLNIFKRFYSSCLKMFINLGPKFIFLKIFNNSILSQVITELTILIFKFKRQIESFVLKNNNKEFITLKLN